MVIQHCFFSKDMDSLSEDLDDLLKLKEQYEFAIETKLINHQKRKLLKNSYEHSKGYNIPSTLEEVVSDLDRAGLDLNIELYPVLDEFRINSLKAILKEERSWGFEFLEDLAFLFLNNLIPEYKPSSRFSGSFNGKMIINDETKLLKSIEYRVKESLYLKFLGHSKTLKSIHDSNGLRIMLSTQEQCYDFASWITSGGKRNFIKKTKNKSRNLWKDLPEFANDYIKHPKESGYRGLSRTIKYPVDSSEHGGISLELQILTKKLHEQNEKIAPHETYKREQRKLISEIYPQFIINYFEDLLKI